MEVFASDIFQSPPSRETLDMARQMVSTHISPQTKRLLNNWIQFIASPRLHLSSLPASGGEEAPGGGEIDASTQHLIDMQWEKIYIFPPPYNHRILPKDTIKTSLFGKISRGYLLKMHPPNNVLQLDREICLKMSNLTLNRKGTKTGTKERVFEDALKELECLKVLGRFNHPHLIPLLMHGQLAKPKAVHLVLVFPLARCSLADKLRLGEVTLDTIHRARYQIGSALVFLHAVGFAHRDVSLENICELWDGSLVLIDFGLAKPLRLDPTVAAQWQLEPLDLDHLTGARFLVGKLRYLGPEFFLLPSTSVFDLPVADVFSFGVCLLYLAIQSFPYQSRFEQEPQHSVEWRILWTELANNHFALVCESIPPMAWLAPLLYLNPRDRAPLKQVLFPL